MPNSVSLSEMRAYLATSISSLNQNKLNGLLAEVEFRSHLRSLGFDGRVSPGGWIARCDGPGLFGHNTIVYFPDTIQPGVQYPADRELPEPPHALHTICATFHQIGISSYFCAPRVEHQGGVVHATWSAIQLGLPTREAYKFFPDVIQGFNERLRRYNFLKYRTDTDSIPQNSVPEEFSKENIRVAFQSKYFSETSDIDGILWGRQYTYPVEIKEKTAGTDKKVGDYFGLDLGPFVKLAFYAAKRGNLHSLFVVREIDHMESRSLVDWWAITFDRLAQYASWVPQSGGRSMTGGSSSVVKIPKSEFSRLDRGFLDQL